MTWQKVARFDQWVLDSIAKYGYCSFSQGTHIAQDLNFAFADALEAGNDAAQIMLFNPEYKRMDTGELMEEWEIIFAYALERAGLEEEYFFGVHPGDGSDFGLWREEEICY